MNFFHDCDMMLKIHYDHYFHGDKREEDRRLWLELDTFARLCELHLQRTDYGYIQAVHYQITSDGHLSPIGEIGDLTKKVHRVTPKGFAFFLVGGYKQQIKSEANSLRMSWINSASALLGWIVALGVGVFPFFKVDDIKEKEITWLQKRLSQIELRMAADSSKNHKNALRLQNPETNVDSDQPTIEKSKN